MVGKSFFSLLPKYHITPFRVYPVDGRVFCNRSNLDRPFVSCHSSWGWHPFRTKMSWKNRLVAAKKLFFFFFSVALNVKATIHNIHWTRVFQYWNCPSQILSFLIQFYFLIWTREREKESLYFMGDSCIKPAQNTIILVLPARGNANFSYYWRDQVRGKALW